MSMELAKESYSTSPEYLIAGTAVPVVARVKEAAAAVKAGAPVAIADGKVGLYTAADGQVLYGIAADAATSGEEVAVYLAGEFFTDALVLESGVTADAIELAFRNIGIFLK